jgi:ABC-2 type transport system permease protein
MRKATNIFWLGNKELRSFARDFFLVAFVIWSFSFAILSQSQGHLQEVHNASIGVVDEDHSALSRQLAHAFLPPEFKTPVPVAEGDVDHLMNTGQLTFVIDIPPHFERELLGGRQPKLQLIVDATAMTQAGIGSGYAQQIISDEIAAFSRAPI